MSDKVPDPGASSEEVRKVLRSCGWEVSRETLAALSDAVFGASSLRRSPTGKRRWTRDRVDVLVELYRFRDQYGFSLAELAGAVSEPDGFFDDRRRAALRNAETRMAALEYLRRRVRG